MKFKTRSAVVATIGAFMLALSAIPAQAAIVLDENGDGTIGKGDVQQAFGWNNKTMQANQAQVTFKAKFRYTVVFTCQEYDNRSKTFIGEFTDTKVVPASGEMTMGDTAKTKNQFVGWTIDTPAAPAGPDMTESDFEKKCTGGDEYVSGSGDVSPGWLDEVTAVHSSGEKSWKKDDAGVWTLQP
jgi:hypothetical protein